MIPGAPPLQYLLGKRPEIITSPRFTVTRGQKSVLTAADKFRGFAPVAFVYTVVVIIYYEP